MKKRIINYIAKSREDESLEAEALQEMLASVDVLDILWGSPSETEAERAERQSKENAEWEKQRQARQAEIDRQKCPRCGGSGRIAAYYHVDRGICFRCGGTGRR